MLQHSVDDTGPVNPAATEKRRETVEGLNRRISCIHRKYSFRCDRWAASGSKPRPAHQVR